MTQPQAEGIFLKKKWKMSYLLFRPIKFIIIKEGWKRFLNTGEVGEKWKVL